MIRIAGGLLASDDLNKVASLLNEEYQILKERAKVFTAIEEFEQKSQMMVRTWEDYDKILAEDPKYKELTNKLDEISKRVQEKRDEIEAYRQTLKDKDKFNELESQLDHGIDLSELTKEEMRQLRKDLQMIFQDPYGYLDTKMTVGNIIGEGDLGHE